MIRPENIRTKNGDDRPGEGSSADNVLRGAVVSSVYQGSANQLKVELIGGDQVVVDVSGRDAVAAGQRIALSFAADDTWLLAS